jgi:serine O-acetyltransferase
VIGAQSIGHHAVIYQQVTIGAKSVQHDHVGRPRIGNHVFIASGARVIGDIELGDNCTVGANAVVTRSAGSNLVLTGIPATSRPTRIEVQN